MNAPHPGTREYLNQTVQLSALTVLEPRLEDLRFENCRIVGPGVLLLVRDVTLNNISIDPLSAVFWEIPAERTQVVGAIGVERCEFFSCRFDGIGLAGPPQLRDLLAQAGASD